MIVVKPKAGKGSIWRNRLGCRPPKDYKLFIRTKIETPVIKQAIECVVEQIGRHFYEDAVRLEQKVGVVLPFKKPGKCYGCWIPCPRTYYRYRKGIILLCEDMDFDLACVVFAHECGHAVNRKEYIEYAFEGVRRDAIDEAAANYYVERWGFGEQLKHVKDKGIGFVTREDLDHLIPPAWTFPDCDGG
jgi:hypothetical protein